MFLKLEFNCDSKKLKFKEELKVLQNLKRFIEEFTKLPSDTLELSFANGVNAETQIKSQIDLDHFVACNIDQKFATLKIKAIKGKSEISDFIDVSELKGFEKGDAYGLVSDDLNAQRIDQHMEDTFARVFEKNKNHDLLSVDHNQSDYPSNLIFLGEQKSQTVDNRLEILLDETIQVKVNESEEPNGETAHKSDGQLTEADIIKSQLDIVVDEIKKEQAITPQPGLKAHFESRLILIEQQIQLLTDNLTKKLDKKKANKVKEELAQISEPALPVSTKHTTVTCDGCKVVPIIGKRFACIECPDYDLCETCESKNEHTHFMVRCIQPIPSDLLDTIRRRYARGHSKPAINKEDPGMKVSLRFTNDRNRSNNNSSERVAVMERKMKLNKVQQKLVQVSTSSISKSNEKEENDLAQKTKLIQFMLNTTEDTQIHAIIYEFGHLPLEQFVIAVSEKYMRPQ